MARYRKPGFVPAWGTETEDEKGDVHMGSERQKEELLGGEQLFSQQPKDSMRQRVQEHKGRAVAEKEKAASDHHFTSMFWNWT